MKKNRVIVGNKKAYHDYEVLDEIECGIVLEGKEVKSLRQGKGNLKGAWCDIRNGEMFLKGMHIAAYQENSRIGENSVMYLDPYRDRKLLAHKIEIVRLLAKKNQDGVTLVPLDMHFDRNRVKVKVGVCKGKKNYDKREAEKKKEVAKNLKESY